MPSSTVAQILEIKDIRPHSDPEVERLELATLGGWQIVCGKGLYKEGERVVYITPDSLITEGLADALEIRQHLSSVKNPDGSFVTNDKGEVMLRVKQAKLRGEPSFGTTIPEDMLRIAHGINLYDEELGTNLAEKLGILKYEPQMRASAGDAEVDHPLFGKYTSIENIRNYPNVIEEGEQVVLTEKIHGTNCRVGIVDGLWVAGSHGLRRKNPVLDTVTFNTPDYVKVWERNTYWYPLSLEPVRNLLESLAADNNQVILFGEVYGNIQKNYTYGSPNGIGFRAFDLLVNGRYLDYLEFVELCEKFDVPYVPFVAQIPYSFNGVVEFAEGIKTSALSDAHGIEGVVVRPVIERYDRKVGRVILKYITTSYMFNKNKSDYTDL